MNHECLISVFSAIKLGDKGVSRKMDYNQNKIYGSHKKKSQCFSRVANDWTRKLIMRFSRTTTVWTNKIRAAT